MHPLTRSRKLATCLSCSVTNCLDADSRLPAAGEWASVDTKMTEQTIMDVTQNSIKDRKLNPAQIKPLADCHESECRRSQPRGLASAERSTSPKRKHFQSDRVKSTRSSFPIALIFHSIISPRLASS